MQDMNFQTTRSYIEYLQSIGRMSFSFDELESHIPKSKTALLGDLHRLKKAGRITLLREKFYLILSPEYRSKEMLPYTFFIDDLMTWLNRPYYVSLLSAASLHGITTQAVHSVFITTTRPPLRDILKPTIHMHFLVNSHFPQYGIETLKSVTGYMQVSSPELTSIDLLKYPQKSGGIYQTISLIRDLSEKMNVTRFENIIGENQPTVILQRLGFILDRYSKRKDLLPILSKELSGKNLRYTMLAPSESCKKTEKDRFWKVIKNIYEDEIE
jgi:predicted transcriptional regulator of viral defense system